MKSSTFEPGQGTVETYLLLVHIVNNLLIKVNCNIVSTFQQKFTSPSKAIYNSLSLKRSMAISVLKISFAFAEGKHKRKHVKLLTQELYQEICHVINPSAFYSATTRLSQ